MAKSKVRGGVKAHRAKVAARNQKVKSAQSAMQKLFNEAMQKELEALKVQKEGEQPAENTQQ
jgi:hypothetical protein